MIVRSRSTILMPVLTSLLVLTACTPLRIDPPTPEKQSLLVLPATYTKKSERSRHGYYYVYGITSDENLTEPYDAEIRFPLEGDMVIVDALPPGNYHISSFSFFPMGSGGRYYDQNTTKLNYPISLAPNAITIFPYSFDLLSYNKTPGRGATTSYSFDINPVGGEQRKQIMETLAGLDNFESWKMFEEPSPHLERAQGRWAGKWESQGSGDCGSGTLKASVAGTEMSGSGTAGGGKSLTLSATIDDKGKVTGELSDGQGTFARLSGGVYWGGQISGTLDFDNDCEGEWSVLKKG